MCSGYRKENNNLTSVCDFNRLKIVACKQKGMQQLVVLMSTHLFILYLYIFKVTFKIHFMCSQCVCLKSSCKGACCRVPIVQGFNEQLCVNRAVLL